MDLSKLYRVLVLGGAMLAAPACGSTGGDANVQVSGGGVTSSTSGDNGAQAGDTDGGTSNTDNGGTNGGGGPQPW